MSGQWQVNIISTASGAVRNTRRPPVSRIVNGTTIVPVIEERFVIVKQLFLMEELHISQRVEHETVRSAVSLRRQLAVVERLAPDNSAKR